MRRTAQITLITALLALAACAPKLPKGVDADHLTQAVDAAVGDDNTCVILAEAATGKTVWRDGLGHACRIQYPACSTATLVDAEDFAKTAAKTHAPPVRTGCETVSWASGVTRTGLVYGAVMSGKRALPGIEIARRLEAVFNAAGL